MKNRYHKINSFFEYFYIVKKYIILGTIFATFALIILFKERSFILWGFQACTQLLIYFEISPKYQKRTQLKIRMWYICSWYSALVLVTNLIVNICRMNNFILDLTLVKDTINLLPKWIQINPEIIGIEILEEEK